MYYGNGPIVIGCFLHLCRDYSDARSRALYNIGRAHISNGDYQQGLAM